LDAEGVRNGNPELEKTARNPANTAPRKRPSIKKANNATAKKKSAPRRKKTVQP
jgi:hypothetical protein